ncbi:MAG: acetylornithine aminotransferase [Planctomycetota bacterium]|nr:MAG: acetylornithine aminotransferase [Planctomycetota bacterium]
MTTIANPPMKGASPAEALGGAPLIRTALPGPIGAGLVARDVRVSSPSNTRDYPLVVKRALGCVVEDVDGNRFLDLAAGIAVCATGHCHPKVVAAIQRQSAELIHICGSDFYYPVMIELMEKLSAITPGDKPKRVLLTNSGTEATEAAFKLSRFHTKRKWAIGFHGSFHGRTMGSLSLTCSKARQKQGFGPLVPMVAHAPYGDVDFIRNVLFKQQMQPDEVAAIFFEPIQGEGGYLIPEASFVQGLRKLCDEYGILLICDEIQAGMGRTGRMFACEHFGVVPDIVLSAKGLASGMPIAAVIAQEPIMNWPPGAQGSTYGGNPVSCAAALATIELVESELRANAAALGPRLLAQLQGISSRRSCVVRPRGLGLMAGVDIVQPKTGKPDVGLRSQILQGAYQRGVILLPCGESGIRFCPPLVISERELQTGLERFEEAAAAVE